MKKSEINIIEIDGRDARYQTGIGRYFDILADNMPKNIKTTRIIFLNSPVYKEIQIKEVPGGMEVHHPSGFPSVTLFEATFLMISEKLHKMQNLIVKCNCLGYEQFAYMIRSRIYCKTIGILHCMPYQPSKNMPANMPNPYFNMDHIILVADNGKIFLNVVKNTRPFSIIYNGITKPHSKSSKKNDDTFRFIFANGLAKHKGFLKIVPAIRTVAEKYNIEIMFLGGTPNETTGVEEIKNLPIKLLGLVTDPAEIAKYYEIADAALFASESEACSFAGIEAMAYNLPIVSTDAIGLVEMFDRAALYTKMNDKHEINTEDYANNMLRIIENKALRTKLSIFAYSRYLERYTAKRMINQTIDVYKKMI